MYCYSRRPRRLELSGITFHLFIFLDKFPQKIQKWVQKSFSRGFAPEMKCTMNFYAFPQSEGSRILPLVAVNWWLLAS